MNFKERKKGYIEGKKVDNDISQKQKLFFEKRCEICIVVKFSTSKSTGLKQL